MERCFDGSASIATAPPSSIATAPPSSIATTEGFMAEQDQFSLVPVVGSTSNSIDEVVISDSDVEWHRNPELEEESESDLDFGDELEQEDGNVTDNDDISFHEDVFDRIINANSDNDLEEVYIDRGIIGQKFERVGDGRVTLQMGMLFVDVYEFRETLKDFAIQEGFELIRMKNEKSRVIAKCAAEGCTWRIHASSVADGLTYKIKTYIPDHNCIRTTKNSNANSTWIAKKLQTKLAADPNMSYASMKAELREKYGLEAKNLMQLYRARRRVKEENEGSYAESYDKLPAWAKLARVTNPESIVKIELAAWIDRNPQFKRFFVCFDAMKKGFVRGCRPWFGIDGCHLKGNYGGILLSAVAIDGNKGMFPLAFAVVEAECMDSWKFFLNLLHDALSPVPEWKEEPLTIMSDMQKGLVGAVGEYFPASKHRFCCKHLLNNFKLNFNTLMLTNKFWAAARAFNVTEFESCIVELRSISDGAANWLLSPERPKEMWARHTLDHRCKSDHITNNVSESFNQWVGEDRKKPILGLVESLTCRIMSRFQKRYEKGVSFEYFKTPRVRKDIDRTMQGGRRCFATYAGEDEFRVRDRSSNYVVNLRNRSCGCNYWNICGLPCIHACACITFKRTNVEWYCDDFYSNAMYCITYQGIIHPMPEVDENDRDGFPTIEPPRLRRLPGRPRVSRRRGVNEGRGGTQDARRSNTVRCSICKQFGHNKKGCQRDKTAKQKKNDVAATSSTAAAGGSSGTTSAATGGVSSTSSAAGKKRQRNALAIVEAFASQVNPSSTCEKILPRGKGKQQNT